MPPQFVQGKKENLAEVISSSSGINSSSAALSSSRESNAVIVLPLVELSLQNVTYSPVAPTSSTKSRKTILTNISTTISPYQLSAWMGPSGSGKTSLISVAAGLTRQGDLSDESVILINGEQGRLPKRLVGVVWQDDLLLSNLSVEEIITFSARLKSPKSMSDAAVHQVVLETMDELGLTHIRHSLIGNARMRGISGGERKRVSVASELVVRPSLLLLDEPTSGLDSTAAQALMTTLKELTCKGHAIAVVIHQPRTAIYNMVDHVLLLSQGHVVFDGKSTDARMYLETIPTIAALPEETGIADWMMDTIVQVEQRKSENVLIEHWKNHGNAIHHVDPEISRYQRPKHSLSTLRELNAIPKFNTSFWTQLRLLTGRTLKQQRGERLTCVATFLTLAYTMFTSLIWFRLPDDTSSIYQRNSLLFFLLIALSNGVILGGMTVFQQERALLERERAKKLYGVLPYFLAKTASDMSTSVLLPCVNASVVYWVANLRPTGRAFIQFLLAFYLTLSTAQSMGLFISISIPNMSMALLIAPAVTLFFMIMGGFYVPLQSMTPLVRWVSWLSFARYGYSSFVVNEFQGRDMACAAKEDAVVLAVGESIGECPVSGDDVLASMGIEGISTNFWFNVGIVLLLQLVFRVAAYVLLRRHKK